MYASSNYIPLEYVLIALTLNVGMQKNYHSNSFFEKPGTAETECTRQGLQGQMLWAN